MTTYRKNLLTWALTMDFMPKLRLLNGPDYWISLTVSLFLRLDQLPPKQLIRAFLRCRLTNIDRLARPAEYPAEHRLESFE